MSWHKGLDPKSVAFSIASDQSKYIRVLAGPGTGKSFALKRRVARLLDSGIAPDRILAVTFTKVAAEDLHRELTSMEVPGCAELLGSTLHSLGMKILSRQNVLAVTGRVARPLNIFEIEPLLYDLPKEFGNKRDREKRIRAFEAAWARLQHEQPGFAQSAEDVSFEKCLLRWLRFHQGMLVGEIIPQLYTYLRNNPLAPELSLYDHVLVDEYQDLNKAEQAVIDLLSTSSDLCVVGDDDQSLYSFKYAHPDGIRLFSETHPGCKDHLLVECFRCPTRIVSISNALISNNKDREPRTLTAIAANGPGEMWIRQYENITHEAEAIAKFIDDQINKYGRNPGEILVLAQRRTIGNPIHASLKSRGIPSKSYYQENELNSINAQERLAMLKLLINRKDRVALRWLLGKDSDNFLANSYAKLRAHCESTGDSPWDALVAIEQGTVKLPHTHQMLKRFHAIKNELKFLEDHSSMADFVRRWLRDEFQDIGELRILVSGLIDGVMDPGTLLSEIVDAVSQPEIPPDVTEVRIMSLHKSKGLSSPVVIIAGCVDGLLPAEPDSGTSTAEREAHIEEQRQLFYVGITRVKAAPQSNRPGSLLLTGSRTMDLAGAMQSGIKPATTSYGMVLLHMSRFIPELGDIAPKPQKG